MIKFDFKVKGQNELFARFKEENERANELKGLSPQAGIYPDFQARATKNDVPPYLYMWWQEFGSDDFNVHFPARYWFRDGINSNYEEWIDYLNKYTKLAIEGKMPTVTAGMLMANKIREGLQTSIEEKEVVDEWIGHDSVIAKWQG